MEVDLIKDITSKAPVEQHKVRLGPDVFECAPKLPAGIIQDIMRMRGVFQKIQADLAAGRDVDEEQVAATNLKLFDILDIVLLPESAQRFAERMRDPINPIDMTDVGNFVSWMLEEYGQRPTKPSPSSAPSPSTIGTSSTDGAWPIREPLPDYSTSPI